ncbi:MAG: sigma-54 interaction domain-containing protein [Eubacteriaceae bacterium]|jgi:arginine utilization regulatory protein
MNDSQLNQLMKILSDCGLGALLIHENGTLLSVNQRGDALLHGNGKLAGSSLPAFLKPLCEEPADESHYLRVQFGEYITRKPYPAPDFLPEGTRLIVFRNATCDYNLDMVLSVMNHINEGVVMCDEEGRLNYLNDPAIMLDSLVEENVIGEDVNDVYSMNDQQSCSLPKVIRDGRTIPNQRHRYTTRFGKKVDAVANTYPAFKNGKIIGGLNIVQDWRAIDNLHKQVIDLQEKLGKYDSSETGKSSNKSGLSASYTFEDIIYTSPSMRRLIDQCKQVAKTDFPVMIYGETGTGKELFAQSIHNASNRADGPFLAINCAALPENLLESLLFGTVKGSFTGSENRAGLFEQANHGTLLLDEINSMDITLQAKLLRVLQDGMIRRVGSSTEVKVDVRVLSCLNIPPLQAIAENKLRQDLFYRLGVVNIDIPPLRERKEDIALLTKHFIVECNQKLLKNVRNIDDDTRTIFNAYDWPGNARELRHTIEHAMIILPENETYITRTYVSGTILSVTDKPAAAAATAVPSTARLTLCSEKKQKTRLVNWLRNTAAARS